MLKIIEDAAEKSGGLVELARRIGISHQSFYSWKRIPAERVLQFEAITGVPREELRPDIFGAGASASEAPPGLSPRSRSRTLHREPAKAVGGAS